MLPDFIKPGSPVRDAVTGRWGLVFRLLDEDAVEIVFVVDAMTELKVIYSGFTLNLAADHVALIVDPCLCKLKPGEPIFVLRGQDTSTPTLVREWADKNLQICQAKYTEAYYKAHLMETWPNRKAAD
jgi:hypothetical protein